MPQIAVINESTQRVYRQYRCRCAKDAACLRAAVEPGLGPGLGRRPRHLQFHPEEPDAGRGQLVAGVSRRQRPSGRTRLSRSDERRSANLQGFCQNPAERPCEPQRRSDPRTLRDGCRSLAEWRLSGLQGGFLGRRGLRSSRSDQYGYQIGGVLVTDFITPNWYAPEHAGKNIDFKNHANTAFAVLPGGYAQKFDPRHRWVQVTGHMAASTQRSHAAPGTRRERPTRLSEGLQRSKVNRG
jgi:hypothetical protein